MGETRGRRQPSGWRKRRPGDLYLGGPVQLAWLHEARKLGLSALVVGLECWFRAGLERDNSLMFRLNLSNLKAFPGESRYSARRGLKRLEEAGLVNVARQPGRKLLVSIRLVGEPGEPALDAQEGPGLSPEQVEDLQAGWDRVFGRRPPSAARKCATRGAPRGGGP